MKQIYKSFSETTSEVEEILTNHSSTTKSVSLILADCQKGLGKDDWDKKDSMWKLKDFEEILKFSKVINRPLSL